MLGNIRHTAAEQAAMLKASSASVVIGSAEQLARLTEHADELHDVRRWYRLDGTATHDGPVTDDGAELRRGPGTSASCSPGNPNRHDQASTTTPTCG